MVSRWMWWDLRGEALARFPGQICRVSHSGHEGKERQRQMFVRHRNIGIGQSWWLLFSCLCGWGKAMQRRGIWPSLSSEVVRKHLHKTATLCTYLCQQLPTAFWGWVSAGIKLLCRGVCRSHMQPQAQPTASGEQHSITSLDTGALQVQTGSITESGYPQETGVKPSHERTVSFVSLSFSCIACRQGHEPWGWFVLYLRRGTVVL